MPLFSEDQLLENPPAAGDAARRMAWTREAGTRRIILGFVIVLVVWFGANRVRDNMLLRTVWQPLQPESDGLSVVGTLDRRDFMTGMCFESFRPITQRVSN